MGMDLMRGTVLAADTEASTVTTASASRMIIGAMARMIVAMVLMKPTALFVTTQSSQIQIKGVTARIIAETILMKQVALFVTIRRPSDGTSGATDTSVAVMDQMRGTVPVVLGSTVITTTAYGVLRSAME